MKKSLYLLLLLPIGFMSCKEEDIKPDPFAHVPLGEIVPLAERNEILMGNTNLDDGPGIIKWWKYKVGNTDFTCEEMADEYLLPLNYLYVSFRADGSIYAKDEASGESYDTEKQWSWADTQKSAIVLNILPDVKFIIRALNPSTIIYASQHGSGECKAVAWEEFTSPIIEKIGSTDGLAETGYIVPLGERDEMLYGTAGSTKWWEALGLNIYYNCEEYEDEEFRGGDRYMAFKSNGIFYSKEGEFGDERILGTWEWTGSDKTAIYINDITDEILTIAALNEEQFIVQGEKKYMDCAATIIEIFGNPVIQ